MILPVQLMISAVKISEGWPLTKWMRIVLPFIVTITATNTATKDRECRQPTPHRWPRIPTTLRRKMQVARCRLSCVLCVAVALGNSEQQCDREVALRRGNGLPLPFGHPKHVLPIHYPKKPTTLPYRAGSVASFLSFVGFVQRSPDHLIQASHKQPSHDLKSKNGQPMDRGTYHRARGLFGFGYRAIHHQSGCPNGAQGDSPGQSEAPPWDWCARNNPSPERAEPAARKPMCYVSPFQGLGELGRRRAQVAGVPRVALRSTLGYLIMPRWGERSRVKNSGTDRRTCR